MSFYRWRVRGAFFLLLASSLSAAEPFSHHTWDEVLQTHVNGIGEVDYEALQASPAGLERYLEALAAASPESDPQRFPSRRHELAYWINAYNAFTVKAVLDRYPVESVRKVSRFFERRDFVAGGRRLSLDDIEHDILRGRYKEPRIHFAIVCASVSCPALSDRAFMAGGLEEQLDAAARLFVNQRRNLNIDDSGSEISLSKIFDWFEDDFEAATGRKGPDAVLAFVQPYAAESLSQRLAGLASPRVRYFSYDWSLNRPGSRAASSNHFEVELSAETGR